MFCPECGAEYRDGYTFCNDCNCKLVENLFATSVQPQVDRGEPVLLCVTADDFEAEIILSKLRGEGVFAQKRYRDTDSYNKIFMGKTILGVEIWVSALDFSNASEIIDIK